jgi:3-methylfumaryl-CoA hydratase
MNQSDLQAWIGRTESREDDVTPAPIAALGATLDRDDPSPQTGDPVPPLWHWLYFLPLHRASEIASDGHAQRGAFMPPVQLPRRMFAGGRYRFDRPLRVGDRVSRVSRIADVKLKEGRTGPLVFVVVRHELSGPEGISVTEEHDVVDRGRPATGDSPARPEAAPTDASWRMEIRPDPVLLFRYSALTFNGHRIHYDRTYATEVEGYPGLVVHGPLIATLLVELLRRKLPHADLREFSFRAVRPLFDVAPFTVAGVQDTATTVRLWAMDAEGWLGMHATATLA